MNSPIVAEGRQLKHKREGIKFFKSLIKVASLVEEKREVLKTKESAHCLFELVKRAPKIALKINLETTHDKISYAITQLKPGIHFRSVTLNSANRIPVGSKLQ